MGRYYDFIAWSDTQAAHGDVQGVGAVGTGDTMLELHRSSKGLFKFLNVRPSNESRGFDNVGNSGVNTAFDGQVLGVEVCKGDVHTLLSKVFFGQNQ
jgi:hypothetical protein